MNHICHLCDRSGVEPLIEFGDHPIAHHFLTDAAQAEYTHPVTLGFCDRCGLTQLIDPISPEKFYTDYHCLSSWKWNPHVPRLLQMIGQLSGLRKDLAVLEVGSNDGGFLSELVGQGFSRILGIEPAQDAVAAAKQRGVPTRNAYFTPKVAHEISSSFGQCDLFISRQVLEHVTNLSDFAEAMRVVLRPGAHVLVEVPNFGFNQEAPDYSAIWEEHVNHFTLATLTRFLADTGVEVLHNETAVFSGDILIVLGRYTGSRVNTPATPTEGRAKVFAYRDRWPGFRAAFHEYLAAERAAGRKIAVYGAGCRSCCLINYAGLRPHLAFALDDQPEKQGKFMPGSRLPVMPSDALVNEGIGLCLLAVNAENEEKVINRHPAFVARRGQFVSMHPPSPRLPAFWKQFRQ